MSRFGPPAGYTRPALSPGAPGDDLEARAHRERVVVDGGDSAPSEASHSRQPGPGRGPEHASYSASSAVVVRLPPAATSRSRNGPGHDSLHPGGAHGVQVGLRRHTNRPLPRRRRAGRPTAREPEAGEQCVPVSGHLRAWAAGSAPGRQPARQRQDTVGDLALGAYRGAP